MIFHCTQWIIIYDLCTCMLFRFHRQNIWNSPKQNTWIERKHPPYLSDQQRQPTISESLYIYVPITTAFLREPVHTCMYVLTPPYSRSYSGDTPVCMCLYPGCYTANGTNERQSWPSIVPRPFRALVYKSWALSLHKKGLGLGRLIRTICSWGASAVVPMWPCHSGTTALAPKLPEIMYVLYMYGWLASSFYTLTCRSVTFTTNVRTYTLLSMAMFEPSTSGAHRVLRQLRMWAVHVCSNLECVWNRHANKHARGHSNVQEVEAHTATTTSSRYGWAIQATAHSFLTATKYGLQASEEHQVSFIVMVGIIVYVRVCYEAFGMDRWTCSG